ncbi:HD-GYP domain-containing protein [Bythopirellula goksoeyrii]|uniref:Cyclic di-GMP phosphodiesterase response regulator RpfG n=1 Tax=Bythopirellula goksoeyrii TaxID=1400387 RepID=A0A5B9Q592_9BACT|nr:HD-GYP domain-containing protein [Bythopirellula goksoeyrii]QEG34208.1 Cyclic di-GMP phosphodiesterase response regulator RpfG [Bythopirellula goksoeyrii]
MTTELADIPLSEATESRQLRELEDACGMRFDTWTNSGDKWVCSSGGMESTALDEDSIQEICLTVRSTRRLATMNIDTGATLVAIPWKDPETRVPRVLTGVVDTDSLQLLLFSIKQTLKVEQQLEELEGLREENSVFLRQVTEDFEELTFLRSMAEHLTLENNNQGLTQLTNYTLSLLGQLVGIEQLYFLENVKGKSEVRASWGASSKTNQALANWQIEAVTDSVSGQLNGRPLVRNQIKPLELGYGIRTVQELIIVPVSTTLTRIGWLVAINRNELDSENSTDARWVLSQNELGSRETSLLTTAAAMLGSHSNNLSLFEEREKLLVNVVRALVSAIDSRDPYTCGHSERVALYARRLAVEIGLGEDVCERIYLTGLLHDLGKIGIQDSVLKKDGPLTSEEFAEIQQHPELGWSILQGLEQLDYVLPGVLHHHERFDGQGYPDNLRGDETPLEGRLLAVVDAFDAMTSNRTYRPGMPLEKAINILAEGAGTQWDADLVDAFLRILPDIQEIRESYSRPPLPKRTQRASSALEQEISENSVAV